MFFYQRFDKVIYIPILLERGRRYTNSPFASANNIDDLIGSLEKASSSLFKWFKDNLFKGNPDKCHLLLVLMKKQK